jgi:bifunctional non-homologous end joining protein LigD
MPDALKLYKAKRDFRSPPSRRRRPAGQGCLTFVIQKHWASRLHYDFRLELDGTMKSWAVPKGPSYDTHDKRMAVHVEDHPISYSDFEGTIPEKQYGAGKVIIWDKGTWEPVGDPQEGYRKGNLKFQLRGHKMHGNWVLVRMKGGARAKTGTLAADQGKGRVRAPGRGVFGGRRMPDSVKVAADAGHREKLPAKVNGSSRQGRPRPSLPDEAGPAAKKGAPPRPRRRAGESGRQGAAPVCPRAWWKPRCRKNSTPNWRPWSTARPPIRKSGCSRSSSTATACSRASKKARCA